MPTDSPVTTNRPNPAPVPFDATPRVDLMHRGRFLASSSRETAPLPLSIGAAPLGIRLISRRNSAPAAILRARRAFFAAEWSRTY
jgi:hypothetical protein